MEDSGHAQSDAAEESDVLAALGSLADFAGAEQRAQQVAAQRRRRGGDGSGSEGGEESEEGMLPPSKPFTRTMQKHEKEALQKWVQCARCNKWRKVPYDMLDDDIPDAWVCHDNNWDRSHNSCDIPQALSDEQIDDILMQQGEMDHDGAEAAAGVTSLHVNTGYAPNDDDVDYNDPTMYGVVPIRGGSRARAASAARDSPQAAVAGAAGQLIFGKPAVTPRMNGRAVEYATPLPARPGSAGRGGRSMLGGRVARGGNGGGRGRGRIGRGLSEAAAALLDMGYAEDEQDAEDQAMEGSAALPAAGAAAAVTSPFPPGAFRPRQVVWAKVEGHDWWPARVVRRRAVPREVGPPPGAPAYVRQHIPVVFFTRRGIPGEVDEGMDSSTGALAACMRALKGAGNAEEKDAGSGDDEAEFAWLPVNALRPFAEGKRDGIGSSSQDPTLQECIAAAEQAERLQAKVLAGRVASAGSSGAAPAIAEEDTDSDGGWGLPPPTEVAVTPRRGGRGRGRRGGRGGRGRGIKGRGGRWGRRGNRDDFESDTESLDAPPEEAGGVTANKVVVETILGWRWPLTEEEKAEEKEAAQRYAAESRRRLLAIRNGTAAAGDSAETVLDAVEVVAAMPPPPAPTEPAAVAPDGPSAGDAEPMQQDEADAVEALLAAASGDIDITEDRPTGGAAPEYLVKWVGKAHVHNEWVPKDLLLRFAKRKLSNFQRRCGDAPCNEMNPAWKVPQRFVARRPSPNGPGWEVLVKWTHLGYDQCTWEVEGEGVLVMPQYLGLHKALWERQQSAVNRSQPERLAVAEAAKQAAAASTPDVTEQPEWVRGGSLYPHQLAAVNWLRARWAADQPAVVADDIGLGKTASVIAFLQCLRHEMEAVRPILIVAPLTMLPFWEGELGLWVGDDANVIAYAGSTAARTMLHDSELWLAPSSMDGKSATFKTREALPLRVVKPDVIVAAYDALATDVHALKAISWEAVILDERQHGRAQLNKVYAALGELNASFRMLIAGSRAQASGNDAAAIEFLQPQHANMEQLQRNLPKASPEAAAQTSRLKAALQTLTLRRTRPAVDPQPPALLEVLLPVDMTPPQVACYRAVLTRHYELLVDPKPPRHSGHRASQLRSMVTELRKVCAYPALLNDFSTAAAAAQPEAAGQSGAEGGADAPETSADLPLEPAATSGKLQLLRQLLPALRAGDHRVLLLSQSRKALDTVEDFLKGMFGAVAYERIDGSTPASQRFAAVQRFNQPDSTAWIFMLSVRSCGLGTDLPGISAVLVHDSDWDPRLDLQVMSHAHRIGKGGKLPVYRLLMRNTVEERLLALSTERRRTFATLARPTAGRSSPEGSRLLEDVVRWRVEQLFTSDALPQLLDAAPDAANTAAMPAAETAQPAAEGAETALKQEDGASNATAGPAAGKEPESDAKLASQLVNDASVLPEPALQQLVGIADEVRASPDWTPMANGSEGASGEATPRLVTGKLGAGLEAVSTREWQPNEWGGDDVIDETSEQEGEDEEEEPPAAEEAANGVGNGLIVRTNSIASASSFWKTLLEPHYKLLQRQEEEALAEQQADDADNDPSVALGDSDVEEDDDEELQASRAGSGLTASTSDRDADYIDRSARMRGGRGRFRAAGGGRGRVGRRRRGEDDDPAVALDEGRGKRRRRGVAGATDGRSSVTVEEAYQLREEWVRHETVMEAIKNPTTLEGGIARRANERLNQIAVDLQLDASVVELAHQAAHILLMTRSETEEPSDFQNYTLVALVGVAVHLAGAAPPEPSMLATLARRYGEKTVELEQVFEYIMNSLSQYRSTHERMQALLKEGAFNTLGGLPGATAGQLHRGQVSDMDTFSTRLAEIITSDYTAMALAAGPLDRDIPAEPLQALTPNDGSEDAQQAHGVFLDLRRTQQQVALFDRMHSIRVKAIQEEYQRYMERVRTKAQNAIDQANTQYQQARATLTSRVDAAVHYLQTRQLQQQQAAALQAQAAAQQQGQGGGGGDAGQDGWQRQQQEPGLAELTQNQAFMQYVQQQGSGMTAAQLEQLKRAFLEQQRQEQAQLQQQQLLMQHQAAQQQAQRAGSGEPAQRDSQGGGDGNSGEGAAANGAQGGTGASKPPLAPQQQQHQQGLPHVNSAPQLSKAQQSAQGGGQSGGQAGGYPPGSQGFLTPQQQQQQLLARHLSNSSSLPLNRLTPQQSQQVLNHWQSQQPEQTTVIQHARPDKGGMGAVSTPPPASTAFSAGYPTFLTTAGSAGPRDTNSPSPTGAATLSKTASGSLVRGVTVQSGAPGLPGSVKGTRDSSPFDSIELEATRQRSASRTFSESLDMTRTHSGPLPIVTSGGRGGGQGSGDISMALGQRPSISTGAGIRQQHRMTPLRPAPSSPPVVPLESRASAFAAPSQQQPPQQPQQTSPSGSPLGRGATDESLPAAPEAARPSTDAWEALATAAAEQPASPGQLQGRTGSLRQWISQDDAAVAQGGQAAATPEAARETAAPPSTALSDEAAPPH